MVAWWEFYDGSGVLRPEWTGLRVKQPDYPHIWLIDQGRRRYIPNMTTYDRLFIDTNGIRTDLPIHNMTQGPDIDTRTIIVAPRGFPNYWVLVEWVVSGPYEYGYYKRYIHYQNRQKWYFDSANVLNVPDILVDAIMWQGPEFK